MSEWVNEWMYEWVNVWMNDMGVDRWMDGCLFINQRKRLRNTFLNGFSAWN